MTLIPIGTEVKRFKGKRQPQGGGDINFYGSSPEDFPRLISSTTSL